MIEDWDYRDLLATFLAAEYACVSFGGKIEPNGQLLLRHDIDFDCGLALEIAKIEARLGVSSTFFFMLTSPGYNALAAENREMIGEIMGLGHTISLHFDPTAYADYHGGLKRELEIFTAAFKVAPQIISLHRPAPEFLTLDQRIGGVEHTYLSKYRKAITYLSDSTGTWRYGHPFDSEAFKKRQTIQLLTHPIWWTVPGATATDKLRTFFTGKRSSLAANYAANCKPFEAILHEFS